jgi:hypothetical protein
MVRQARHGGAVRTAPCTEEGRHSGWHQLREEERNNGRGWGWGSRGQRRDAGIAFSIAPFPPFLPKRGQRVDGHGTIWNSGDEGRDRKAVGPAVGMRFALGWSYGARSKSKGRKYFR